MLDPTRRVERKAWRTGGFAGGERVIPEETAIAILIVESTSAAGGAEARAASPVAPRTPAERATPRRISRPRSRSRARDKRALIVPTGRPR